MTVVDVWRGEEYLARRLAKHGVAGIFNGITDPEKRKERFRKAIIDGNLDCIVLGPGRDGKTLTYAIAFERLYGESLTTKLTHKG